VFKFYTQSNFLLFSIHHLYIQNSISKPYDLQIKVAFYHFTAIKFENLSYKYLASLMITKALWKHLTYYSCYYCYFDFTLSLHSKSKLIIVMFIILHTTH